MRCVDAGSGREDWLEKIDLFLQVKSIVNEDKKKTSPLLLMDNEDEDL